MTNVTIPFGKHRGTPLVDMDPGYLNWMLRKSAEADAWAGLVRFVRKNDAAIREAIAGAAKRAAESFEVDYTLNDSQTAAVDAIVASFKAGDSYFRLEGGAGYGKSFTVMEVVRQLGLAGVKVQACATSYVATQVLSKQLSPLQVEAKTIASTIRLAKVEFEDQEEYEATPETGDALRTLLARGRALIVDEYSMVGDDIADAMMEAAASQGGFLLVVGDLKQLPPVKQNWDSSFTRIPGNVTLTQPMRYSADSDLFALEQLARHNPKQVTTAAASDEVVWHDSRHALTQQFVADMKADPRADARMLFFRRADVMDANFAIREALFGAAAIEQPVVEDERLMVMSTADVDCGQADPVRFYSGQTFLVERVTETEVQGIPCYNVTFHGGTTVPVIFASSVALTDTSKRGGEQFSARLRELRDEAVESGDWREWRAFKNAFLQVGYNYAMTVHRAQGQTVDRVYFDPATLRGPMSEKLTYVAATRAKQQAHMVRPR
jgi:ATP-dependent exoDNAse (exonuclease V) alpha subunit